MKPWLRRIGIALAVILLLFVALNAAYFWLLNNVPSNAETEKFLIADFEKDGLPVAACQPKLLYRTRFLMDNTFVLELTGGPRDTFALGVKSWPLSPQEDLTGERRVVAHMLQLAGVPMDLNAEITAGSMQIGHILYLIRDRSRVFLIRSDL